MELEGKIALVTGAAQGIGQAIAAGLEAAGATVVRADRTPADGIVPLDVSDGRAVAEVVAGLERIDILVNNAGIFPRSPVLDLAEDEWDRVLSVNLKGAYLCAQAAGRAMRDQGTGGRIVSITSGAAFVPTAQSAAYAASKAGLVALTRVLALELAPHRITVNAVAPGLTDTAQPRSFYSDADLEGIATRIPAGRIAQPEEMVPAVLFLCGESAGYLTGQTLHVNGGLFMP